MSPSRLVCLCRIQLSWNGASQRTSVPVCPGHIRIAHFVVVVLRHFLLCAVVAPVNVQQACSQCVRPAMQISVVQLRRLNASARSIERQGDRTTGKHKASRKSPATRSIGRQAMAPHIGLDSDACDVQKWGEHGEGSNGLQQGAGGYRPSMRVREAESLPVTQVYNALTSELIRAGSLKRKFMPVRATGE